MAQWKPHRHSPSTYRPLFISPFCWDIRVRRVSYVLFLSFGMSQIRSGRGSDCRAPCLPAPIRIRIPAQKPEPPQNLEPLCLCATPRGGYQKCLVCTNLGVRTCTPRWRAPLNRGSEYGLPRWALVVTAPNHVFAPPTGPGTPFLSLPEVFPPRGLGGSNPPPITATLPFGRRQGDRQVTGRGDSTETGRG
jgi:hypothetical protein